LDRRLGGPQSRCGRRGEEQILELRDSNSDLSAVLPVASSYTDYANPVLLGGGYDSLYLLGHNAVESVEVEYTFQSNMSTPSSELRIIQARSQNEGGGKQKSIGRCGV
jgi:hypothetical protein